MKKIIFTVALVAASFVANAQGGVGVGTTTPDASSALDVTSTTKGFLMPRMTTTERTAITSPATGLQVYDTDTNTQWYYNGTAWVNAATAGTEWIHNGTDAIEATRALANGNTISVTDSGKIFNNLGEYDWTTQLVSNGLNVAWSSNPKNYYPKVNLQTSDALSYVSPGYTTSGYGRYTFNLDNAIIKETHIANATASSKNYFLNSDFIELHNTSSAIQNLISSQNVAQAASTSSSSIVSLMGSQDLGYNYGTGTIGILSGNNALAYNFSSGNVNNIYAYNGVAATTATTTGNTTSLFGGNFASTHSGTGTLVNLRGVSSSSLISSTGSIPSSSIGLLSNITNSSTSLNSSSVNLTGAQFNVLNNGIAKFTNLYGTYNSTVNAPGAGAFTNGYGILNLLTNNATTTDAISTIYGYNSTIAHNGNSPVANMGGLFLTTQTNNTAVGIPNNLYGANLNTNLRTTTTGVSNNLIGILNNTLNSGAVNTSNIHGLNQTTLVSGTGFANSSIKGIFSVVTNSNTGSGTTPDVIGEHSITTNSSTSNTVLNLKGNLISVANSGKLSNSIFGIQSTINNTSTQGNNITDAVGIHNTVTFPNTSTDNVSRIYGQYNYLNFSSSGLASHLYGNYIYNLNNTTSSGTVNEQIGNNVINEKGGASSVTTNIGAYVTNAFSATSTGTVVNNYGIRYRTNYIAGSTVSITNNYGLYLDNVAGGVANNYAIYSAGGNSYLKDKLLINTTTATDAMLNVNGAIQVGTYTGGTPIAGMIRFNTTTSKFEGYNGTAWVEFH